MRGKGPPVADMWKRSGITPAYAGKSVLGDPRRLLSGDHPRLCGEKVSVSHSSQTFVGSPPPMRGKGYKAIRSRCSRGITPAYAGKRSGKENQTECYKDHPRLCGEKYREALSSNDDAGSPPPMRGKVCITCYRNLIAGITPAYAGKSKLHACL